jgi:hypothetical protein
MGLASAMSSLAGIAHAVIGRPTTLRDDVLARYPELAAVRWRRGGLPVRVGGWCLGRSTVSAITLWRTIWIAPHVEPSVGLLLHEYRHVEQFASSRTFAFKYLWQSLRHGYVRNCYEADARAYADARLAGIPPERMV